MPLGLTIGQPPPNGVVIIGETTLVTGIATGTGGAEPVLVDSVTVQIGGGPLVIAGLSIGGEARVFKAEVVVPGPPGPVVVTVTAHFDGPRVLTKSVTAIATEGALTGCWTSDDGMLFFLSQNGNSLWWVGLDQGPGLQGQGLNVTTVFQGAVNPVTTTNAQAAGIAGPAIGIPPPVTLGIQGGWADVPRGTRLLSGTLILQGGPDGVQALNVAAQTGGFTASTLRRIVYAPPQQEDIQSLFELVNKNLSDSETLASEGGLLNLPNLTAWKDPVVVFGSVAAGETGGVSMVVNRTPTDGVTYQNFICTHDGGSLDSDVNFDLILDSNWLDPNFWTEGWEPGVDPQNFQAKVNASSGRLHLELVMFARNASCSQPDSYNGPALLPGWQEMGGDSVLINGRPLDGALQTQPDPGHSPPPLQVTVIGGKTIRILDTVRVTGALVLDCGHTTGIGTLFDRCQASNASYANQEIHPVYAIDVIDATSQDNLSAVWGDNYGMTYYVSQVGDTVWWFGMGPFRNGSLAQVFQGVATNGTIAGSWQGVPLATGVSGEPLELAIDPGRMLLMPVSSTSLSGRRWMKLYDAGVQSNIAAAQGRAAG